MIATKALACTGFRVLEDNVFFMQVCVAYWLISIVVPSCSNVNMTGTRGLRGQQVMQSITKSL
jgi:hypothetical protein